MRDPLPVLQVVVYSGSQFRGYHAAGGLIQVSPNGDAGIGWYEDKGKPEGVASLSLGTDREFALGAGLAARCNEVWRMRLTHASLLLIPARTNEALKHRLPPVKRVKEPRANVTLRRFSIEERKGEL
jgi:alkylated DNA repair dioxygenase AlkB